MTLREYKKLTLAEMMKLQWRTTRKVETGMMIIPAGTIVQIVDKFNGVTIVGPKCEHCGVAVFCRRLDPAAVECVEE